MNKNKIHIYIDGPSLDEITSFLKYDGFTFNPSIYKKLGAKNYLDFSKQILEKTDNKPVSIEVIADDFETCYLQAMKIKELDNNVFVKIPITYTNGESTITLIKKLTSEGVKLNITAIFTLGQVKKILGEIKDSKHILSIFSGRIYDIGLDGGALFKEMSDYIHNNSSCLSLWASCRMTYDLLAAEKAGGDIITMPPSFIQKLSLFGKKPEEFSLETVKGFFNDSKKANFKI